MDIPSGFTDWFYNEGKEVAIERVWEWEQQGETLAETELGKLVESICGMCLKAMLRKDQSLSAGIKGALLILMAAIDLQDDYLAYRLLEDVNSIEKGGEKR